jgi:septum formation inhibitor-activating ATPase MinD
MKMALIDRVIGQIVNDLDGGDFTAINELLDNLSFEQLNSFLPEENQMKNRVQLQREYVDRVVDNMDASDLAMIVADMLHEKLEDLTDEQLFEEVEEYYPDLVEQYDGSTISD